LSLVISTELRRSKHVANAPHKNGFVPMFLSPQTRMIPQNRE
jgi:hypothetical protein